MAARIEDYAIVGDTRSVALIDRAGSVDWWCVPRIDSPACFAALLGDRSNGRWLLRPAGAVTSTSRRYREGTLVLETTYVTETGVATVTDFMLPGAERPTIFRIVDGVSGSVEMELDLVVRFDYGSVVPWVRRTGDGLTMVAGPEALLFHSPVPLRGADHSTAAKFTVSTNQRRAFSLGWYASIEPVPMPLDALGALTRTTRW